MLPRELGKPSRPIGRFFGATIMITVLFVLGLSGSLYHADGDARLYLFSTIAQTVGAMFGISITVILMAVQVGAQFVPAHRVILALVRDRIIAISIALNLLVVIVSLLLLPNEHVIAVSTAWLAASDESMTVVLAVVSVASLPVALFRALHVITPVGLAGNLLRDLDGSSLRFSLTDDAQKLYAYVPVEDLIMGEASRGHLVVANQLISMVTERIISVVNTHKNSTYFADQARSGVFSIWQHSRRLLQGIDPARHRYLRLPLKDVSDWLFAHRTSLPEIRHCQELLLTGATALPETVNEQVVYFLISFGFEAIAFGDHELARKAADAITDKGLSKDAREYILVLFLLKKKAESTTSASEFLRMLGIQVPEATS